MLNLDAIYRYHPPRPDQIPRFQELREAAHDLAVTIQELTPVCAEQTLAQRAVQQAVMWANAAIAIHERKPSLEDPDD